MTSKAITCTVYQAENAKRHHHKIINFNGYWHQAASVKSSNALLLESDTVRKYGPAQ